MKTEPAFPLPAGHALKLLTNQDKAQCVKGIARDLAGASRTTDDFRPTKYGLQLYHNFSIEELEVLARTNIGVALVLTNMRNVGLFGGLTDIRQHARALIEHTKPERALALAA